MDADRETLHELLDRIVFAAGWNEQRRERHDLDAQRLRLKPELTENERWNLGFENGAAFARGDGSRTLESIAESLAAILGVELPSYEDANERNLARALKHVEQWQAEQRREPGPGRV